MPSLHHQAQVKEEEEEWKQEFYLDPRQTGIPEDDAEGGNDDNNDDNDDNHDNHDNVTSENDNDNDNLKHENDDRVEVNDDQEHDNRDNDNNDDNDDNDDAVETYDGIGDGDQLDNINLERYGKGEEEEVERQQDSGGERVESDLAHEMVG